MDKPFFNKVPYHAYNTGNLIFDLMTLPKTGKELAMGDSVTEKMLEDGGMPDAENPYKEHDLLPCPFCGEKPLIRTNAAVTVVECDTTGCMIWIARTTTAATIEKWNTRTPQWKPEQVELVKRFMNASAYLLHIPLAKDRQVKFEEVKNELIAAMEGK